MSIRIDVVRHDGNITRLTGKSGIAVCAPDLNADIATSDPATVSLRCDDTRELAWNLATLQSAIHHVSPEAYVMAHALAGFINSADPQLHQFLPPQVGTPAPEGT